MITKTAIPRLSCGWVSHPTAKRRSYNAATTLLTTRSHYSYAGPGHFHGTDDSYADHWKERQWTQRGFTVGIGGPVGSGKTALVLKLTKEWSKTLSQTQLGVVTNDIFTQEDAEFLTRNKALPAERIAAVETGGCPHAAIREDVSANLGELERLTKTIQKEVNDDQVVPLLLCESGGDNLAANFSRELADLTLYVIDVSGGDKIPRKGGPGITQSDLLIINKIDIADAVGSSLEVMKSDGEKMRGTGDGGVGPMVFCSVKQGTRVEDISDFIMKMYEKATGKQAL